MFTVLENTNEAAKNLSSLLSGLGIKLPAKDAGNFALFLQQAFGSKAPISPLPSFSKTTNNIELQSFANLLSADDSRTAALRTAATGMEIQGAGNLRQNRARLILKTDKPVLLALKTPGSSEIIPFRVESVYLPEAGKISFAEKTAAAVEPSGTASRRAPGNSATLVFLKENGQVLVKISGEFPAADADSLKTQDNPIAPLTPGAVELLQRQPAGNPAIFLFNHSEPNSALTPNAMKTETFATISPSRPLSDSIQLANENAASSGVNYPAAKGGSIQTTNENPGAGGTSIPEGNFAAKTGSISPNMLSEKPQTSQSATVSSGKTAAMNLNLPAGKAAPSETGEKNEPGLKIFPPPDLQNTVTTPEATVSKTAAPGSKALALSQPESGNGSLPTPELRGTAEKIAEKPVELARSLTSAEQKTAVDNILPGNRTNRSQNEKNSGPITTNLFRTFSGNAPEANETIPKPARGAETTIQMNSPGRTPITEEIYPQNLPDYFPKSSPSAASVSGPDIFSISEASQDKHGAKITTTVKTNSLSKFWQWLSNQIRPSLSREVGIRKAISSDNLQPFNQTRLHLSSENGQAAMPVSNVAPQTDIKPPVFPELSVKELTAAMAAAPKGGGPEQKGGGSVSPGDGNHGINDAPVLPRLVPEKPELSAEKRPPAAPVSQNPVKSKKSAFSASGKPETEPFSAPLPMAKGDGTNSPKFGLEQHFRNDFATMIASANSAAAKINSLRGAKIARVQPHQLPEFLQSTVGNFIKHFDLNLQPAVQNVFLQLEPESLGLVRIRLELKDNMLRGHLEASRPEALQILHQQQPQLVNKLENLGIQVRQLDLNLNQNMDSRAAFSHYRPDGDGKKRFGSGEGEFSNSENSLDEPVTNIPKWMGYNTIDLMA